MTAQYTEHDRERVAADLLSGRAQIVNRHSTSCVELTWLGPEESSWLGEDFDGAWSADTGFVCKDCAQEAWNEQVEAQA